MKQHSRKFCTSEYCCWRKVSTGTRLGGYWMSWWRSSTPGMCCVYKYVCVFYVQMVIFLYVLCCDVLCCVVMCYLLFAYNGMASSGGIFRYLPPFTITPSQQHFITNILHFSHRMLYYVAWRYVTLRCITGPICSYWRGLAVRWMRLFEPDGSIYQSINQNMVYEWYCAMNNFSNNNIASDIYLTIVVNNCM